MDLTIWLVMLKHQALCVCVCRQAEVALGWMNLLEQEREQAKFEMQLTLQTLIALHVK